MQSKVKADAATFHTDTLATAALLLLLSASAASAATITVDDSGGDVSGDGLVDSLDCTYCAGD